MINSSRCENGEKQRLGLRFVLWLGLRRKDMSRLQNGSVTSRAKASAITRGSPFGVSESLK